MGVSSGTIPLYREFIEASSCEIFRPKAPRLQCYSDAKSKPIFPTKCDERRKTRWYLTESFSNEKIRSKIGKAVPEFPKNVTDFREKMRTNTSKFGSGVLVFHPIIAFKLLEKMDIVYAHDNWWKNIRWRPKVMTCWRHVSVRIRLSTLFLA